MTVNVMVKIGGKVGGQVISHAVKILERVQKRGRLLVHRLDAHDRARFPRNILGKLDQSLFDDGSNAHVGILRGKHINVNLRWFVKCGNDALALALKWEVAELILFVRRLRGLR
jgi:hypothetical protein